MTTCQHQNTNADRVIECFFYPGELSRSITDSVHCKDSVIAETDELRRLRIIDGNVKLGLDRGAIGDTRTGVSPMLHPCSLSRGLYRKKKEISLLIRKPCSRVCYANIPACMSPG
jgi:hypothetical protein